MGFLVQSRLEKQSGNKHVESTSVTCLDEGSTPSSSTKKDRRVAVFFYELEGVGSMRRGEKLRVFRSSALRLARWRNGHRRFLSSPAPLGRPRVPPFFSTTKVAKIDPLFLFCHGRAIIIMSLRYIKQSFVMPVDGLIMVKNIF